VTPSVLIISCSASIGSGFALKLAPDQGYSTVVATAAHVVKGCSPQAGADVTPGQVTVTQAGRTIPATLKSIDVDHDVALLQVTAQVQPLEPASAEPKPGQFVMAVGTPLGKNALANSVTQGNVSKVSGEQLTHTANISNGNSGGPLVDRSGNVVAIVVGAFTANDQAPVVENLNVAVRLMALCDSALSGSACSTLH
jgi:S1-C subfamily serine protease